MKALGIAAAMAVAVGGPAAMAADAAGKFIYVVNGTGHPFALGVDGDHSPEVGQMVGALRPTSSGSHTLIGEVAGAPKATMLVDLKDAEAVSDNHGHTFWCFVVGQRASGELVFVTANQPQCAELLRKAADGPAAK
jgi:hypothetical protein